MLSETQSQRVLSDWQVSHDLCRENFAKKNFVTNKSNFGMDNNTFVMDQNNFVMDKNNFVMDQNNFVIDKSKFVMEKIILSWQVWATVQYSQFVSNLFATSSQLYFNFFFW